MAERGSLKARGLDVALGLLAAAAERRPGGRPTLAVLTYHRVAPAAERGDLLPGLAVDPAEFAAQVRQLVAHADPVSIDDLLAAESGGPALPRRAVHVTFDDAYACIAEHAWPVLREAGVPATMFVPTAYPDQPLGFWWDRLHQAVAAAPGPELRADGRSWTLATTAERDRARDDLKAAVGERPHAEARRLVDEVVAAAGLAPAEPATSSWAELRRLADEGLALAPHSRTHPFLDRLEPGDLDGEIAGSMADLRREVGSAARPAFAYPGGHLDDLVVAATARAGLRLGFTTARGVSAGATDPPWLRLPRINVGRRASAPLVRAQLRPEAHRILDLVPSSPRRALWN